MVGGGRIIVKIRGEGAEQKAQASWGGGGEERGRSPWHAHSQKMFLFLKLLEMLQCTSMDVQKKCIEENRNLLRRINKTAHV